MVADPKALQYILHTPGYNFPKRRDMVKVTEMVVGKALTCSHGAISFFYTQLPLVCDKPTMLLFQGKSMNIRGRSWHLRSSFHN